MTYLQRLLHGLACAALCALAAIAVPAYAQDDDDERDQPRHHGSRDFGIEVLSGRPDTIAGGDALIRVSVKKKQIKLGEVRVELNGVDVTAAFTADSTG